MWGIFQFLLNELLIMENRTRYRFLPQHTCCIPLFIFVNRKKILVLLLTMH